MNEGVPCNRVLNIRRFESMQDSNLRQNRLKNKCLTREYMSTHRITHQNGGNSFEGKFRLKMVVES
jgi:hypothetical protein